MASNLPSEAPPSYESVAGSSSNAASSAQPQGSSHLEVPGPQRNGIPVDRRRSMEDELRPLPKNWVRTFDPDSSHQFFVDTSADPPRSIWHHPYDDDEYLRTLSSDERERIEEESLRHPPGRIPSKADIMDEHTDEEDLRSSSELPPRPDPNVSKKEGKKSLGRKVKDKLTGSTHEEREQQRAQRAERERELYQRHLAVRSAMAEAMRTGQPQLIGRDRQGKDVYIEPPAYRGGFGGGGYGYNPYGAGGMYAAPNARYMRPAGMYGRRPGMGYGGGYGMPLALGGGLLGGMMLGGAMGGF